MMRVFNQSPSIELARPIFIECMKYGVAIPYPILQSINPSIEKEHKKYLSTNNERLENKHFEKFRNEVLLQFAMRSDYLTEAYEDFRSVFPETESTDSNKTLRMRLMRRLDKEIQSYIKNALAGVYPYDLPPFTSLKDRLELYKNFLQSEL
jgi:hypothetical protein